MPIPFDAKTAVHKLRQILPSRRKTNVPVTSVLIEPVKNLDSIGPGHFDTSVALKRLVLEENPPLEEIFSLKPEHQITYSDIDAQFFGEGGVFDWRKKAIVNTLRRAASETIASILTTETLNFALPSSDTQVTPEMTTFLQARAVAASDLIKPIAERLGLGYEPQPFPWKDFGTKPPEGTVFEIALKKLRDYFGDELFGNEYAFHMARRDTFHHIIVQDLTRNLAPSYIKTLIDVYSRDRKKFPELTTEYPTFQLLQQLVANSDAIMIRGAAHTVFDLGLYGEIAVEYDESIRAAHQNPRRNVGLVFKPDQFELRQSKKKGGGYTIMITDAAMKKLMELHKTRQNTGIYHVMETGCPANAQLIRAIINKAVNT